MGCCDCNCANRINGINIMILCAVVVINFWFEFNSAQGLSCTQYPTQEMCNGYSTCKWDLGKRLCDVDPELESPPEQIGSCRDGMDMPTCQGRLAAGIFATIGGLVSLFGACSKNNEKNQATVAAAFALINLAHAAFLFGEHENPLQEGDFRADQYVSGTSNLIGALCGIVFALWSCKSGEQQNNLAFIMSIFFYAFSFSVNSWTLFDKNCSSKELEDTDAAQGKALDGDACTMQAFAGIFGLACMLFCIFAAVQVCCMTSQQPRVQNFVLQLAISMVFAYWVATFWFRFANATTFGENPCNTSKPQDSTEKGSGGFCFTQFMGAAAATAGIPIALLCVGTAFCCKCIAGDEDENDVYGTNGGSFGV